MIPEIFPSPLARVKTHRKCNPPKPSCRSVTMSSIAHGTKTPKDRRPPLLPSIKTINKHFNLHKPHPTIPFHSPRAPERTTRSPNRSYTTQHQTERPNPSLFLFDRKRHFPSKKFWKRLNDHQNPPMTTEQRPSGRRKRSIARRNQQRSAPPVETERRSEGEAHACSRARPAPHPPGFRSTSVRKIGFGSLSRGSHPGRCRLSRISRKVGTPTPRRPASGRCFSRSPR